jgi:adenine/guanine phosphoribosyltransferase-like PRPP-binding protein
VVSVVGAKIVSLPRDTIKPGERSVFVDDRLITGATARAVVDMIYEAFSATILGIVVAERHWDGDPKLNWVSDLPVDCLREVGKKVISIA